jgi:hypothetical protein
MIRRLDSIPTLKIASFETIRAVAASRWQVQALANLDRPAILLLKILRNFSQRR